MTSINNWNDLIVWFNQLTVVQGKLLLLVFILLMVALLLWLCLSPTKQ